MASSPVLAYVSRPGRSEPMEPEAWLRLLRVCAMGSAVVEGRSGEVSLDTGSGASPVAVVGGWTGSAAAVVSGGDIVGTAVGSDGGNDGCTCVSAGCVVGAGVAVGAGSVVGSRAPSTAGAAAGGATGGSVDDDGAAGAGATGWSPTAASPPC